MSVTKITFGGNLQKSPKMKGLTGVSQWAFRKLFH